MITNLSKEDQKVEPEKTITIIDYYCNSVEWNCKHMFFRTYASTFLVFYSLLGVVLGSAIMVKKGIW